MQAHCVTMTPKKNKNILLPDAPGQSKIHNSNSVNYYAPLQTFAMDEFADNIIDDVIVPEKKPHIQ